MRQKTYKELFRIGDVVEIAQAPHDGETEIRWLRGTVIKITVRLHVKHCSCSDRDYCTHIHMAYERSLYKNGHLRKLALSLEHAHKPEMREVGADLRKRMTARAKEGR